MPMEKERYPTNWKEIARGIKEEAGWKCQRCGKQCRKPGEPFDTHKRTLTVAHLNHTPEDIRPENLMAMCAPCHLRYDKEHHAETRRRKRMKKEETRRECGSCKENDDGLCNRLGKEVDDDDHACVYWEKTEENRRYCQNG